MVSIFFAYFALVSIVAGVLTVSLRNPVHCGIALLALLGHVAGLFVLLHAEFVAVVQIIIYAGAILILYLFVLMLLNLKTEERYFHRRHAWYITGVGALTVELLLVLLASRFGGAKGPATVEWAVTSNDAHTWPRPWTFAMNLTKDATQGIFEYGCHEGNYGLRDILSGARADDAAAAKAVVK